MGTLLQQWFVLIGLGYLYTGANIILSTTGGINDSHVSQCNTTKTVICHIESYTLMTWTIDNTRVAGCTLTVCSSYPALPSNAVFNSTPNTGMFYLTFNQVELSDSGKVIKCSNGTSTADQSLIENVKDLRVTLLESTGPHGLEVKVTTGCVSSNTHLIFAWYKIKVNTSDVVDYTVGNESKLTDNVTCSSDLICGSSETKKHTRLLIVTETSETDGGVDHYLRSIVTFRDNGFSYAVPTDSTKTYKLVVSGSSGVSNGNRCDWICIVLICVVVAVGTVIIIIVIVVKARRKQVKGYRVKEVTDSKIIVMWDKNTKGCCQAKYILRCSGKEEIVLPYTINEYEFTKLSSGKTYTLEIQEKICIGIHGHKTTMYVKTKDKPAKPTEFKPAKNGIAERSITVQWKPGDNGGHQQTFILTCAQQEQKIVHLTGEELLKHTFKKLLKETCYDISIYARNEIGPSEVDTLNLRTHGKPAKPTEFKLAKNGIAERSITVQWIPGDNGGHQQTFILTCAQQEQKIVHLTGEELLKHTFKKLSEGTCYDISIYARNEIGPSEVDTLNLRTHGLPVLPDRPKKMSDVALTNPKKDEAFYPGLDGGYTETF